LKTGRFLKKINKSNKACNQNIGTNTLGEYPRIIATFLNKQDLARYTCHSFRRTGASILAEGGASLLTIKAAGGWRSDTVAQKYIDKSSNMQRSISSVINQRGMSSTDIARETTHTEAQLAAMVQSLTIAPTHCSHFSINFYGSSSSAPPTIKTTEHHHHEQQAKRQRVDNAIGEDKKASDDEEESEDLFASIC